MMAAPAVKQWDQKCCYIPVRILEVLDGLFIWLCIKNAFPLVLYATRVPMIPLDVNIFNGFYGLGKSQFFKTPPSGLV
jgi:hypothetical protein